MQATTLFATSDAQTDARVNNSSVWVQALPVTATAGTQISGFSGLACAMQTTAAVELRLERRLTAVALVTAMRHSVAAAQAAVGTPRV